MPAPPLGVVIQSSSKPGKAADIHTIILGNGTELKPTLTEIPDPPAYSGAPTWKGIKDKFFKWKVLVHCFQCGSPKEFWSEFTTAGKPLSYTAIVRQLQEQCEAEYGDTFNHVFSYHGHGSEQVVMSKTSDIAKHYCKLHDLSSLE
ncbi:hypothetical protein L208DRAFT_1417600 [Tricholoma matsutake]|nr:hypothetical protein L208DRAFT_1417600 [Tricholoma matsutake 945]